MEGMRQDGGQSRADLQVDHSQCFVLYVGAFHRTLVHLRAWVALQLNIRSEAL